MLFPLDRPVMTGGVGIAPAPSPVVPGDTTSMLAAPAAAPVTVQPSRTIYQGLGVHLDPTSGVTLNDAPTTAPVTFTPPATPVAGSGGSSSAPPATPIGSSGSSLRPIVPRDRPNVDLIPSAAPQAAPSTATSPTPIVALVSIVAALALAWWFLRGRL